MAQARADSVPMLVLSAVNARDSLGKGLGYLHELPDQHGLAAKVALTSERVEAPERLIPALDRALARIATGRPGPVHVEVPLDVAGLPFAGDVAPHGPHPRPEPDPDAIDEAAARLRAARRPVILAGGGAKGAGDLAALAERLGAPVVQTVNARGTMFRHPLGVPASPSLEAVRALIDDADAVLAVGTELGPTDFDMYATGRSARLSGVVRVDICPEQLARHPADLTLHATVEAAVPALLAALGPGMGAQDGAARAEGARQAAWAEIGDEMRAQVRLLDAIRDAVPGAAIVGDSTQPVYAGNLFYDHDRPGGWFNAATGYGALGYAIPAAIGAAIGRPNLPVVCLIGDGGAQFSLPELMTAVDERAPVVFVVWNNRGYGEIAAAMRGAGVEVVGCDPTPPDFAGIAAACRVPHAAIPPDAAALTAALDAARRTGGPAMIEIAIPT
jgi:acetolactate synthase-1/2/3 large subunit